MIMRLIKFGFSRASVLQVAACLIFLLTGMCGLAAIAALKEAPAEVSFHEPSLRVRAITAMPEDIQVRIVGYGEVRPLDIVSIAAEIPGQVVTVHPRLESGEIIAKDEVLFKIDPRDYEAAHKQAHARVRQRENAISQLQIQHTADLERLKTLERNRQLARLQLDRMQELFEEHGIAARSQVEEAEQGFNSIAELAIQLAHAVELYPIQIKDANDNLSFARAELEVAEANLERCVIRAPFDARIKDTSVEAGEYLVPGAEVMTLADDSTLEIHAPLDSRDAQRWLRFSDNGPQARTAWFSGLEPVPCTIRWTEAPENQTWTGLLHRVVKFERQTRTLTVGIRIDADSALSHDPLRLPLVEGMFCAVEIPGKILNGVFQLPPWAVSFEDTVFIARNNRLKTVPVRVARREGERTLVAEGLNKGDIVITTRLVDPLENSLLDIMQDESTATERGSTS